METESPVSKVGRVKFGWRLGLETVSATVVAVRAEATTVGVALAKNTVLLVDSVAC